jgi:hypothetical protein
MEQSFNIEVTITDEKKHCYANIFGDGGLYKIFLSKQELAEYNLDPLIVAMHELGHVLCKHFGAPYNNQYVDYHRFSFMPPPPEVILGAEREAWDVAELVVRLQHAKRFALGKYEEKYATPDWYKP